MAAAAPAEPCPVCKGFGVVETPEGRLVACSCRSAARAEARLEAAVIAER